MRVSMMSYGTAYAEKTAALKHSLCWDGSFRFRNEDRFWNCGMLARRSDNGRWTAYNGTNDSYRTIGEACEAAAKHLKAQYTLCFNQGTAPETCGLNYTCPECGATCWLGPCVWLPSGDGQMHQHCYRVAHNRKQAAAAAIDALLAPPVFAIAAQCQESIMREWVADLTSQIHDLSEAIENQGKIFQKLNTGILPNHADAMLDAGEEMQRLAEKMNGFLRARNALWAKMPVESDPWPTPGEDDDMEPSMRDYDGDDLGYEPYGYAYSESYGAGYPHVEGAMI